MEEAEVICQRMAHVRQHMDHRVDDVVEKAREMVDWRQFVRHYPWLIVGASVTTGYLLVPRKTQALKPETLAVAQMMEGRPVDAQVKVRSRWRILAPLVSMAGTAILRTAVTVAAGQATQWLQTQEALRQAAQDQTKRPF